MHIASSQLDLKNSLLDGQDRKVKSSSTENKNEQVTLNGSLLFVQSIGYSGGGRFITDPEDMETGDHASVLSHLTLGVIEVRRYGDNNFRHRNAEICFCSFLNTHIILMLKTNFD